ncbi:MAG TPA: DNA polymerase III subunit gamma and tau [Nocardioidaceae bacterium]|nr:DNA polymerase III subunit gamma and tau [Nocardioidaceae bacterium]
MWTEGVGLSATSVRVRKVTAPLALYRRYRPETFAEVIGQDHVTQPLRHALESNRVHHAYLFSGPRGCGKTTSARILARALNCKRAPVAEPCGECDSCRDLARGGPGSLDVIEIDAASHGGVDDARDLRERAFFAPVSSRYKIYIIDEAHMVTAQGFNALLKLVEEPPDHLKFVFATTEPDKVIGTIRSRTHHYPFRLVPPRLLTDYLSELCEREGVALDPTSAPLVVRAGAGSVRDTLSVLDQLIAGAGEEGVTYSRAAALLGYTPDSLLDDAVDAFAAGDGATVFGVVDKVIDSGQEPRRFAEDLLRRFRDLIVVSAVPGAIGKGLLEVPGDAAERLESQAARYGPAELTHAAEVVSQGLDEIRGATAPRLLLELICARLLLPGADDSEAGVQARLDRLERRLTIAGAEPEAAGAVPAAPAAPDRPAAAEAPTAPPAESKPKSKRAPKAKASPSKKSEEPAAAAPAPEQSTPESKPPEPESAEAEPSTGGGLSLVDVRRLWPQVLESVMAKRRFAWVMLSQNANVHALEGNTLTIAVVNAGARDSFVRSGCDDILRQALVDVIGVEWAVETVVDPSANPASPSGSSRAAAKPPAEPASPPPVANGAREDARNAIEPTRNGPRSRDEERAADADAHPDDPTIDEGVDHDELLARELGAKVIEEIPHD